MSCNIKIKNYKAISEADVSIEGITMIWGRNAAGKSTLLNALTSLLSNQWKGTPIRHGAEELSINVNIEGEGVGYTRTEEGTSLKINDGPTQNKLGRNPLYTLSPSFPLKRIDYDDSQFFPNFALQGKVPMLDDISIYDCFSSMFHTVSQLTSELSELQTQLSAARTEINSATRVLEFSQNQVKEAKISLDNVKNEIPDYENLYIQWKEFDKQNQKAIEFETELQRLAGLCTDPKERALLEKETEIRSLFSDALKKQNIFTYQDTISKNEKRIQEIDERLNKLPQNWEKINVLLPLLQSSFSLDFSLNKVQSQISELDKEILDLKELIKEQSVKAKEDTATSEQPLFCTFIQNNSQCPHFTKLISGVTDV